MREIKFRAWEKNRKEMLEVLGIFFDVKTIKHKNLKIRGNTNPFNDGYPNTNFQDIELMQYTGLKDKNGKEIYEGDILLWRDKKYQVKWTEARFVMETPFLTGLMGNWFEGDIPEVIGNIYENPELLKVK